MASCVGCWCGRPSPAGSGEVVLVCTRVSHTAAALRARAGQLGAGCTARSAGLLELHAPDVGSLLAQLRAVVSSVEAAEVRVLTPDGADGADLLAAALSAPTLAEVAARVEHADLLPLFADELGAFRSVYQPIVSLGDGTGPDPTVGFEALLRATGPAGQLMPEAMFGAAEAAGWLHVLDRVGRTTALRGAGGWLGDRKLFVNFLPTTIYRPQVCLQTTERAAARAGLRLDQLVFEVTESERVKDLEHLAEVFAYYRERGCRVALDDLGAGYSSLNMLVRLQPDVVKLDKEIVQRLPGGAAAAVVSAVVEITHSYGGQVLAECVETAEQVQTARELGVDLGQGWYFGRPVEQAALAGTGSASLPGSVASPRAVAGGQHRARSGSATEFNGDDPAVAIPAPPPIPPVDGDPSRGPGPLADRGSADVEALLAHAVQVSGTGLTIADATAPDMPLIYVNAGFETLTGYRAAEVVGRNCRFLQGPDTDPDTMSELRAAVADGAEFAGVLYNRRADGTPWWNELRLSPVRDTRGAVTHYFGFQLDVTERVQAQRRVDRLAFRDPLTELPNRAGLRAELDAQLARAAGQGIEFALLFLDLDGFKEVNDRFGHATGDLALAAVAAGLRSGLRETDVLARYGGDEFIALITDLPADSVDRLARRTADAVLGGLQEPLVVGGHTVRLGASVGVACYPRDAKTVEELLAVADRAMYGMKGAHRAAGSTTGPGHAATRG